MSTRRVLVAGQTTWRAAHLLQGDLEGERRLVTVRFDGSGKEGRVPSDRISEWEPGVRVPVTPVGEEGTTVPGEERRRGAERASASCSRRLFLLA